MGDDFRHFGASDAVGFCRLQMIFERTVGDALANERSDGDKAAIAQRKQIVATPHLTEKNVVVEMSKFGGKLPKLGATSCLCYFLLCHNLN